MIMKASSILALITLGLSGLAQGLPSPSQNPRDSRVGGVSKVDDLPETHPTNDIDFSWCGEYNTTNTCSQKKLKHGWCYDLDALDPAFQNNLEDVGASSGRCMMYRNSDCKGEHTAMFVGQHLWTRFLCPRSHVKWHLQASSVRCCAGSPEDPWCDSKVRSPEGCIADIV